MKDVMKLMIIPPASIREQSIYGKAVI